MSANLSPEYLEAERGYRSAHTLAEKIAALTKMLATVPKHKGTEKMQADLKHRLSEARKESQKSSGAARAAPFYLVDREGAGQIALIGPPNAGKSQLVCALTHARPEVAEYPFTTRLPVPGMMMFENVQVQLVDLPPISSEFTEQWLPQAIRNADHGVMVVDANDPAVLDEVEFINQTLSGWRVPSPRLLAANKSDLEGANDNFTVLQELYGDRFQLLPISAATGLNLDRFRREIFDLLGIVRVYTRVPGHKADLTAPFILPRGQTVIDAARLVHKDFEEHLKFARLYGGSHPHEGLRVERTHVVEDGDILEFHI